MNEKRTEYQQEDIQSNQHLPAFLFHILNRATVRLMESVKKANFNVK